MTVSVFDPVTLAGMKLKNRIIRSATHEGMADEKGFPTGQLKKLYVNLAKGEAGAIITGYAGVRQDGKTCLYNMTMIDSDEKIPAYREITDAVHEYGTPIIMQIAHCGRQTRSKITGLPTVAPSALRHKFYNEDKPRELTEAEINILTDDFAAAFVRAKEAGFDGVQLHLAHGYLLSDFLSSHANRRKDRWGGSTENKYRIAGEIIRKAKERVGDYPVLAKMNAHDRQRNGMRVEEAVLIAQMLEKSGCAAVEVSCGCVEDDLYMARTEKLPAEAIMEYSFNFKKLPAFAKALAIPLAKTFVKQPKPLLKYNLDAAIRIKKAVNIPVIVVGGIHSLEDIRDIIVSDHVDFVSMSRPFIIEPGIVGKFKNGTRDRSKCIMCDYCMIVCEEEPLRCYYGKVPKKREAM